MSTKQIRRTRFAPSPTGKMHIGNLRSALYAWLVSKSHDGQFVLRIEDTDQGRLVEGAVDIIYETLTAVGLSHDEGPDVGGPYAPYTQSERLDHYKPYAEQLVAEGKAYRCFCGKSEEETEESEEGTQNFGYDRHCRNLSDEDIKKNLEAGKPFVIRQKMPLDGTTTFHDAVYGSITVENKELEDQILLKSDGFPTYNFANVVDDHEMKITHVVRGSEYLSSTPKYNLLYEALGWETPEYIHLPLILGTDGKKLSKRHGATSFNDLVAQGFLVEAITNYIAFLGWAPGSDTREIFSLQELREVFDEVHISKSPAVFDYQKLRWYNTQYLRAMEPEAFRAYLAPAAREFFGDQAYDESVLAEILQSRIECTEDLPEMIGFFKEPAPYSEDLFTNKKQKLNPGLSREILSTVISTLEQLPSWNREAIHSALMELGPQHQWKTGQVMGPPRLALSGQQVTPGGSIEMMVILGKEESFRRMRNALEWLSGKEVNNE